LEHIRRTRVLSLTYGDVLRNIDTDGRLLGTFNEGMCQPMQTSSSVFSTTQPTAPEEVGSGGDARTSGNMNSSQTLNPPSAAPSSTTTEGMPVSSLPFSTIGSNPFPNSTPMTFFSESATQELPSKSDEAPPTPRSSSGSVSSISRQSVLSWIPSSSMWSPVTVPPSVASPTPSWALANSPGYDQQADIPVSTACTSSWPIAVPSQSMSAAQQTDRMTSQQPLDPSSNWIFPQELSSANPPPTFQPPTSQAPQSFEGTNTCMSGIYSQTTPSHLPTSSTLPPVSCPTSLQQFGATNFLGPIDPFELFAESDAHASSIRSQDVHPVEVESIFAVQHPISLQNPPVPPKTCQSSAQIDTIAEMMGDLSTHHPEIHSSLAEIPKNISTAQSPLADSFNELPEVVPSWQEMPISRSKMPGDAINRYATWPTSAIEVPAEPYYAVERSQNPPPQFGGDAPTSTYAEMPSHAISQVPQAHQQYPPSIRPQYQSQYQPYRPQMPTPVSHTSFFNPTSIAAPSPISWQEQQHQETDQTAVSPLTQEATAATAAPSVASSVEKEYSLSRSVTLGETRRRNQKALLDLMERGNYG
jgi:hypothetical protein